MSARTSTGRCTCHGQVAEPIAPQASIQAGAGELQQLDIERAIWDCHALVQAIEARASMLEAEGAAPADSTEPVRRLSRIAAGNLARIVPALWAQREGGAA